MSSIGFRQIAKFTGITSAFKSLLAEYQKFAAKSITIENTDFRTKHRSTQSLLKYNELTIQQKTKPVTTMFYAPYEPDFNNVVLMLALNQMGRYAIDSSGFGNRGKIAGAGYMPQKMLDDGIDLGFGENSHYLHFDGMYTFVYVEDAPNIRAQKVNLMSFTFRIYLMLHSWTLSDPDDETKPRYLFAKCDDNNQQYGYACAMDSLGSLKFTWIKHGQKTTIVTPAGTIATSHAGYTDTGYSPVGFDVESLDTEMTQMTSDEDMADTAITTFQIAILCNIQESYDPNGFDAGGFITGDGNDIQIAVDSSALLNNPAPVITYYSDQTDEHLDLFVGNQEDIPDDIDDPVANLKLPNFHENYRLRIGAAYPFSGDQQGWYKWHGGIQDFRIYRDKLLTDEDLQWLFWNRLSIAPYPPDMIAVAGYTLVLPTAIGTAGYTLTGFDGIGFDNGFKPKAAKVTLVENVHVGQ